MEIARKWALVTGASGGLGEQFAENLAKRGANLVLSARKIDNLTKLGERLKNAYGIEVVVETADLTQEGSAAGLFNRVEACGITIDILIANAGFGLHGDFIEQSVGAAEAMLRLNIVSLTTLTHAAAKGMAERGGGHILLVSSMTAFMPAPTYAAYGASKAYVRQFGEALHAELKPRNVVVTVVCPGLMDTGFLNAAGQQASKSMTGAMTSPAVVAKAGLETLFAGRPSVVVGLMNRVVAGVSRLMPRSLQAKTMSSALNS